MSTRGSMKAIFFAIVGVTTSACLPGVASAQQWDPWGGPRRPPAQVPPQDDNPYGDPQDDRRGYDDDRDGPRADNRYDDGNDPRRYDPDYNGDRDYGADRIGPRYRGRAPADQGYFDDRRYGDPSYGDRDGYGAWDAAPSEDDEARLNKAPGTSGGERPYIRPVAPPQISFSGPYAPGSIVIDTSARKLYYVTSTTSAYAYSIGVGRQGFAWTGKEKVSRIADWPDWYPPADMRQRKPELPVRMLGGIRNPLGAKAIYLGNTLYRIHGTNDPKSIGKAESSGCFRMLNENVLHLATLVHPGTEVTIVRSLGRNVASAARTSAPRQTPIAKTSPAPRNDDRDGHTADYFDPYNGWH
jgi:lipoprotein-anchoring transpeptidase ErfK/SrfK